MAVLPYWSTVIVVIALQADLFEALVDQGKELFTNKDETFIIGFPAQPSKSATSGSNRLYLTADEYAEAYIQVPSLKRNQIGRLKPGGTLIVPLPGNVRMPSKTGIQKSSGIRIWANASISVYGVDRVTESSDGFLALPLSFLFLGNEYMVMTYTPVIHSVVMVTATLSSTDVTFHLKLTPAAGSVRVDGKTYKNGDTFKVSLNNALDSFQLLADSSLTGTRIVSTKVISVYSGNDCANVPYNMNGCDHLIEQIPPVSTWGKTFIAKTTPYRTAGDFFHILASQNETTVRIELQNTTLSNKINAGEIYIFDAPYNTSHVIVTSKPCLVVQYGKSHNVDGTKFAPFMSIVPPINQWSNDYTLVVPSGLSNNYQCFANIFVRDTETLNIKTKSTSPVHNLSWSKVPVSLYSTTTANLTSGQYRFYHTSPLKFFSVILICHADFEAFGFPAGLRLVQRRPGCTPRLMVPADRKDNDCDGRVDEELLNGVDDDRDGRIDEDLATPIPKMNAPNLVNTSECYVPHRDGGLRQVRIATTPQHQAFGMCNVRGNLKILYLDHHLSSSRCWERKNRTWIFTDGCLNTIKLYQIVNRYEKQPVNVRPPSTEERRLSTCSHCSPSRDYGKPQVTSDCTGSVSMSYTDTSWDVCSKCGYADPVKVYRTWVVSNGCNKQTLIQTLSFQNFGSRPRVSVTPQSIVSATSKNITIQCFTDGVPRPEVMWILPNGVSLNKSYSVIETEVLDDLTQRVRIKAVLDDNSLLISESRAVDAGIYKCVSRNVLGNATAAANVTIHQDIIDVDASITITDMQYSPDLKNPDSEVAAELTSKIKKELTKIFMNITGFQEVKILGYRNGSVKVLFRVVVKKQNKDENPQVVVKKVGQHLAVSVKTGKLGDYEVIPTVELREKPPPPDKIKASEIKESQVHVEWDPPELHVLFSISGYLLQYKRFGHGQWKTYDTVKGDNHRIDGLESGTAYQIRTKAKNKYGHSEPSKSLEITTLDSGLSGAVIALIVIIPLIFIIICAVVVWYICKKRRTMTTFKRSNSDHLLDNGVVRYTRPSDKIHIDENHKWKELSRDNLELGLVLGEGQFGMVIEGKLTQEDGSTIRCAVKKLKRTATESDMKDLLNELDIMMQVGSHPNIVNLIGACAYGGPVMVVVEFCANGNLLRYLQKQSSKTYEDMHEYVLHISPKERLKIASDVANGMAHLARRRCVHRDLAARNVLLDDKWTAKVSDFGLSRDVYTDSVYEKTTGGKLPAKWMAIEALEAGLNTTQSDVWSFGVLLWEIETGGCIPYPAFSAMEMLAAVKQGYRLEKPTSCSIALYNIMLRCWEADPSARPSFDDLYLDLYQLQEATPSSPSYYENMNEDDPMNVTYT